MGAGFEQNIDGVVSEFRQAMSTTNPNVKITGQQALELYEDGEAALLIRKLQTENRMLKRQRNEEAFSYFNEFNDDEIAKKLSDGHIAEHDAEIQEEVSKVK